MEKTTSLEIDNDDPDKLLIKSQVEKVFQDREKTIFSVNEENNGFDTRVIETHYYAVNGKKDLIRKNITKEEAKNFLITKLHEGGSPFRDILLLVKNDNGDIDLYMDNDVTGNIKKIYYKIMGRKM